MRPTWTQAAPKLRQARLDAGLTIEAVVERTGVSRTMLYAYESDSYEPSACVLLHLCSTYGLDPRELARP